MWAPIGYVRFDEVASKLADRLSGFPDADILEFWEESGPSGYMWTAALDAFVADCPSLSVCSPDGRVMRIASRILQRRKCQVNSYGLMFVDAHTWTVKLQPIPQIALDYAANIKEGKIEFDTGYTNFDDEEMPWIPGSVDDEILDLMEAVDDEKFHNFFRNFSGWSVVCLEKDAPGNSTPADQMLDYFASSANLSLPDIVKKIVADYDANGQVVRDEAHSKYCPDMKRDAFRAVWGLAANQRPNLSRRGPKRLQIKG